MDWEEFLSLHLVGVVFVSGISFIIYEPLLIAIAMIAFSIILYSFYFCRHGAKKARTV